MGHTRLERDVKEEMEAGKRERLSYVSTRGAAETYRQTDAHIDRLEGWLREIDRHTERQTVTYRLKE